TSLVVAVWREGLATCRGRFDLTTRVRAAGGYLADHGHRVVGGGSLVNAAEKPPGPGIRPAAHVINAQEGDCPGRYCDLNNEPPQRSCFHFCSEKERRDPAAAGRGVAMCTGALFRRRRQEFLSAALCARDL